MINVARLHLLEKRAFCGSKGLEDDTPWPLSHRLHLWEKQPHREGQSPLSRGQEAPSQSRRQLAPRGGPERKASDAWIYSPKRKNHNPPRTKTAEAAIAF